jgi:hypothetical protein
MKIKTPMGNEMSSSSDNQYTYFSFPCLTGKDDKRVEIIVNAFKETHNTANSIFVYTECSATFFGKADLYWRTDICEILKSKTENIFYVRPKPIICGCDRQ